MNFHFLGGFLVGVIVPNSWSGVIINNILIFKCVCPNRSPTEDIRKQRWQSVHLIVGNGPHSPYVLQQRSSPLLAGEAKTRPSLSDFPSKQISGFAYLKLISLVV